MLNYIQLSILPCLVTRFLLFIEHQFHSFNPQAMCKLIMTELTDNRWQLMKLSEVLWKSTIFEHLNNID